MYCAECGKEIIKGKTAHGLCKKCYQRKYMRERYQKLHGISENTEKKSAIYYRAVLELKNGACQSDVAKKLNLSRQRIFQIKKKAEQEGLL